MTKRLSSLPLAGLLLACLILSGCTSIPLGTLWQMRNVDPLSVDPAGIRVAVRMPDAYDIREDGALLTIAMSRQAEEAGQEEDDTPREIEEVYVLESSAELASPFLRRQEKEGYRLLTFWLDSSDYDRMRAMQRTMKQWKKASPGKSQGSLSVGTQPCLAGTPQDRRLLVSTYIRLEPDREFMTLTRDMDFARNTDFDALVENMPACEE